MKRAFNVLSISRIGKTGIRKIIELRTKIPLQKNDKNAPKFMIASNEKSFTFTLREINSVNHKRDSNFFVTVEKIIIYIKQSSYLW